MIANAVNLASFANVLCHLDTTPLSVAVLAPCAWGGNLACGVAWQGALNSAKRNTAWRGEFDNETAKHSKIQRHSNKIQHNEFIKANIANGTHSTTNSIKYGEFGNANNARQIRLGKRGEIGGVCGQSENGAVFGRGSSLSLSLSLSLASFLFAFYFFNFLNLFARFPLLLRQKFINFTCFHGLLAMIAHLVILSVATKRLARRKPQQKIHIPYSVFRSPCSVWILRCAQYDRI